MEERSLAHKMSYKLKCRLPIGIFEILMHFILLCCLVALSIDEKCSLRSVFKNSIDTIKNALKQHNIFINKIRQRFKSLS